MGFVETAADPWGREVLTHVAWNVLWVSIFVFITFLIAHASYVILSAHRVRAKAETDALKRSTPACRGASSGTRSWRGCSTG